MKMEEPRIEFQPLELEGVFTQSPGQNNTRNNFCVSGRGIPSAMDMSNPCLRRGNGSSIGQ